jgi:hypothetical protein
VRDDDNPRAADAIRLLDNPSDREPDDLRRGNEASCPSAGQTPKSRTKPIGNLGRSGKLAGRPRPLLPGFGTKPTLP